MLIIVAAAAYAAILYLENLGRLRIVGAGAGGALVAVDARGLQLLNAYYAMPKACSEMTGRETTKIFSCYPSLGHIADDMIKPGIVLIPEGTRAEAIGESFVFPNGRLVPQYSGSLFQMARDGAVHVERIRITQPP